MTLTNPTNYEKLWFAGGLSAGSGWLLILDWIAPRWVVLVFASIAAFIGLTWTSLYGRDLAYEMKLERLRVKSTTPCLCRQYETCPRHEQGYD